MISLHRHIQPLLLQRQIVNEHIY